MAEATKNVSRQRAIYDIVMGKLKIGAPGLKDPVRYAIANSVALATEKYLAGDTKPENTNFHLPKKAT